jgi:hypothetical protein
MRYETITFIAEVTIEVVVDDDDGGKPVDAERIVAEIARSRSLRGEDTRRRQVWRPKQLAVTAALVQA